MNEPRKKNPTFGVTILIVVIVAIVLATLFYNAISGKREYDRDNAPATASAASASIASEAGGGSQ